MLRTILSLKSALYTGVYQSQCGIASNKMPDMDCRLIYVRLRLSIARKHYAGAPANTSMKLERWTWAQTVLAGWHWQCQPVVQLATRSPTIC